MAHATYVPAFGRILFFLNPNRATLSIQVRSHSIRPQCCVDRPDLGSRSVDDRNGFSRSLVMTLHMVRSSSWILVPSLGASQRQSRFQRRSWVPTVDQAQWRISSYAILCRIDGERQPLCVLVPILLIRICNVYLQRPRQGLHHSLCCSIRLGSICHSSTLFLPRDPVERSEEIGHES